MQFILLFAILLNNCPDKATDQLLHQLEYSAQTRGYYLNIIAKEKELLVKNAWDESHSNKELTNKEWQNLILLAEKGLLAPEEFRSGNEAYDAAIPATLTISVDQEEYRFWFDHGRPPKELEPLMTFLAQQIEEFD